MLGSKAAHETAEAAKRGASKAWNEAQSGAVKQAVYCVASALQVIIHTSKGGRDALARSNVHSRPHDPPPHMAVSGVRAGAEHGAG
eukprot:6619590-Prymnesium_polylepis.1